MDLQNLIKEIREENEFLVENQQKIEEINEKLIEEKTIFEQIINLKGEQSVKKVEKNAQKKDVFFEGKEKWKKMIEMKKFDTIEEEILKFLEEN